MKFPDLIPVLFLSLLAASFPSVPAQAQWTQSNGPGRVGVQTLFRMGGEVLAGTKAAGTYRSSNNGGTWLPSNTGIETKSVVCMASNAAFTFCGAEFTSGQQGGIYRSSDGGRSWSPSGLSNQTIPALYASDSFILAGTVGSGIFKSTDNGGTWSPSNGGIGNQSIPALASNGGVLFAAGDNNLYRSTDGGANWEFTNGVQYFSLICIAVDGGFMYAGGHGGLIRSTDGGNNWEGPIWVPILPDGVNITSFEVAGSVLYASTGSVVVGFGVIKSTDHGLTWTAANGGCDLTMVSSVAQSGTNLLAATPSRAILASTDGGAHWTSSNAGLPPGGNIRCLLQHGAGIYAGTGGDGIYRSTDRGVTWIPSAMEPSGRLQQEIVDAITDAGGVLLAGSIASGMFRSTDDGATWTAANSGLPIQQYFSIYSLRALTGAVVTGTSFGIFRSTDSGGSWQATNIADYVPSMTSEPGFAYAIVSTGIGGTSGIYRSTNAGVSWSLISPSSGTDPMVLAWGDGFVYLGDLLNGIRRSSDHGVSWIPGDLQGGVFSILPNGSTVYAGGQASQGGMHVSQDHGATWAPLNAGLTPDCAIEALASDGSFLYGGDDARAVWRFPFSLASVDPIRGTLRPIVSAPNPFTSRTGITFQLARSGRVRITIHDPSGRVVDAPIDRDMVAGTQRIEYNGERLAPGAYFIRVATPGGTFMGRMLRVDR